MKQIFIAATRQNDGKTMVSLGLFSALMKRFNAVGYIKPVGQQYKTIDGNFIDKDSILFKKVYNLPQTLTDMSPIAVYKGFTAKYIKKPDPNPLLKKLDLAYKNVSKALDFMLLEGTGHAGVGSVFDLSNASVAKRVKSPVILVSQGGIGRSIDEIMLNKAVFEQQGVDLLGVIINKVKEDKYDKNVPKLKKGLERLGIDVFGCIPFRDVLIRPNIGAIFENLAGTQLNESEKMLAGVDKFIIGDMVPHDALDAISLNTLLIVPANREGLVMTALLGNILETDLSQYVSGIIFTGGKKPHSRVMDLIKRTKIPIKLVDEDSFTIATKINNMLVKVSAEEDQKIKIAQCLIETYVDIDALCNKL